MDDPAGSTGHALVLLNEEVAAVYDRAQFPGALDFAVGNRAGRLEGQEDPGLACSSGGQGHPEIPGPGVVSHCLSAETGPVLRCADPANDERITGYLAQLERYAPASFSGHQGLSAQLGVSHNYRPRPDG